MIKIHYIENTEEKLGFVIEFRVLIFTVSLYILLFFSLIYTIKKKNYA